MDFARELSQSSVTYRILQADAGDRRRMSEIFDEIRRSMPPLRGVIHAAGVLRDAALINQRSGTAMKSGAARSRVHGFYMNSLAIFR